MPKIDREEQHLSQKLANIIHLVIKLITNTDYKQVKEKFPLPLKDDYGLYTWDPNGIFYQSGRFGTTRKTTQVNRATIRETTKKLIK
jgi:hypothetical protein